MKFGGLLIAVSDMKRAKAFYEQVMELKVMMDLGTHVSFENGLGLQQDYQEMVGVELNACDKPDNFQLYFETEDLDGWEEKLTAIADIKFLHRPKTYPWGQRVMRFYDYDNYIIELSESMECVAKRYLAQGMTAEETAERTMYPVEFIRQL
jgi:Lactoylglutathione lyase and related lyases